MGWVFMLIAAVFFFLAGVGATVVPGATTWGLFLMALAFLVEGVPPSLWRKSG